MTRIVIVRLFLMVSGQTSVIISITGPTLARIVVNMCVGFATEVTDPRVAKRTGTRMQKSSKIP